MGEVRYIFDHVDRGLAELVSVLRDKPNVEALVTIMLQEVQELEQAAFACIVERLLDAAAGAQLDQYGAVVGEPRDGLTDGVYRGFIRARILSNLSNGEPERIAAIVRALVSSGPVRYRPEYPAGYALEYVRLDPPVWTSTTMRERVSAQVVEITAAGVEVTAIIEALPGYFGFADDPNALGFDEGTYAEVIN